MSALEEAKQKWHESQGELIWSSQAEYFFNAGMERAGVIINKAIVDCGGETNRPLTRIAFKGGEYGDNEYDMGGLCLESLEKFIKEAIRAEITSTVGTE